MIEFSVNVIVNEVQFRGCTSIMYHWLNSLNPKPKPNTKSQSNLSQNSYSKYYSILTLVLALNPT